MQADETGAEPGTSCVCFAHAVVYSVAASVSTPTESG